MTAKHRKGKSSNKHEENSYKHEVLEPEARPGNHYALLFVLFLIIVIGGATVGWFCFQQHQTLTYLTDNLVGMQMKMVKLQSYQEELRKSTEKHGMEGFEQRLHSLEESYTLTQKQVGVALATAEQLKTSDLPTQVLALHTEMKARIAEMQQATVSSDQLAQLEATLSGQSQEFVAVKQQVQGLAMVSEELAKNLENLSGSLLASEAKLADRAASIEALGAQLEDQAVKLQGVDDLLAAHQVQLETSTQDIVGVKALLEAERDQRSQQANVEEQLSAMSQNLQEQSIAAQSLHSELRVQLEAIQNQVAQLESTGMPEVAPVNEEAPVTATEVAPTAVEIGKTVEEAPEAAAEEAPEAAAEEAPEAAAEEAPEAAAEEAPEAAAEEAPEAPADDAPEAAADDAPEAAADDAPEAAAEEEPATAEAAEDNAPLQAEEAPEGEAAPQEAEERAEPEVVEEAPTQEESTLEQEVEGEPAPAATEEVEEEAQEMGEDLAASEPEVEEEEPVEPEVEEEEPAEDMSAEE